MKWNWQQPDWPNFHWDRLRISAAEEQFLLGAGVAIGTVKHLGEDEQNQLLVEIMSGEAVTTSAIEGEVLNRASVQSSILRQLGLASPDKRRVMPAEQGIAEMMVDLYRSFSQPLSSEMLFNWHRMVTSGRKDLADIGRYRTSREPMQVISGPIGVPTVHFEAPPSKTSPGPDEAVHFMVQSHRTGQQGTVASDHPRRHGPSVFRVDPSL